MSGHRHGRRKGFTLIELLVVIGVIGILAGMIFPVLHLVRAHAMKARTKALIGNISVAVKAYESDWGAWPQITGMSLCSDTPSAASRQTASQVLYFCLCSTFQAGTAETAPSTATPATITPSMTAGPYLELTEKDFNSSGANSSITDAWGNNFAYNADTDYNPGSTPPSHNTSSFDVWSPGQDSLTATAANKEDDVTNW